MPQDISSLVQKEIQLAKSELKVSVKAGGIGIGLFAGAAFVLVLAVIMLSVSIAYFINWNGDGLALHWAFLIVFGFYAPDRRAAHLPRGPQASRRCARPSGRSSRVGRSRRPQGPARSG